MSSKSQLAYIMDMLDIVGTDLAVVLDIDRTLISKWKNGVRTLKPSSKHFNSMVEALIFFNSKNKSASLERFFGQVYPKEDKNEPDYLEVCLRIWLEGKNMGFFNSLNHWQTAENALYASKVDIYQGNQGKRFALIEFFNYASILPPGQEIFISDVEGSSWLEEDEAFANYYKDSINKLTQLGHNITMIIPENQATEKPTQRIINRIHSYFTGNITSYSIDYDCKASLQSLYLIHRHMSLASSCATDDQNLRYITVHKDPFTVKHFVDLFIERIKLAHPLLCNYAIQGKSIDSFIETYDRSRVTTNFMMATPDFPLFMLPHDILMDILDNHKVNHHRKQVVQKIYKHKKELLLKNIHQYDIEVILSKCHFDQLKNETSMSHDALTYLCQTEVRISKENILSAMVQWLNIMKKYDNVHIHLIDFSRIDILEDINLYVFEDHLIVATQLKNYEYFITSESNIVLDQVQWALKDLLMHQEDNNEFEKYCSSLNFSL